MCSPHCILSKVKLRQGDCLPCPNQRQRWNSSPKSSTWSMHETRKSKFHVVVVRSLSRVQLFATLWTIARQAPLSMGISRQEYWSGLPFSSPGDLSDLGVGHASPAGRFLTTKPLETPVRKLQIKTIVRYHYTLIRMVKICNTGEDMKFEFHLHEKEWTQVSWGYHHVINIYYIRWLWPDFYIYDKVIIKAVVKYWTVNITQGFQLYSQPSSLI